MSHSSDGQNHEEEEFLSDPTVFLSTQIQSRLDDLDNEEEEKPAKSELFKKFGHKDVFKPSLIRKPMTNKVNKPKRTEKKRKGKRKVLSVTDQMVRKLSGKPHKLRQMGLNISQKQQCDFNNDLEILSSFEEPEDIYKVVFTEREWNSIRYKIVNSTCKEQWNNTGNEENVYEQSNQTFWNKAGFAPDLHIGDWSSLYHRSDQSRTTFPQPMNPKADSPETLSQLLSGQMNKNNGDKIISIDSDPINNDFSIEEIECSSEEGSLLLQSPSIREIIGTSDDSDSEWNVN